MQAHAGLLDARDLEHTIEQHARPPMLERLAVRPSEYQPARIVPVPFPPRRQHDRRPIVLALERPKDRPGSVELAGDADRAGAPVDRSPVQREQFLLTEPRSE